MCGNEITKAGVTRPDLDHGEEDQERDAGDDFRHHQWLVDEAIDEIEPAIGLGARGGECRHRCGDGREDGRTARNDERAGRGFDNLRIVPGGNVPAPGETFPYRNGRSGIEGIDDQRGNGYIEQNEAEQGDYAETRLTLD